METHLTLERLWHKNAEWLAIKFKYDAEINNLLKKSQGARWSNTHKALLLNYSQTQVDCICKLLYEKKIKFLFKDKLKETEKLPFRAKEPITKRESLNDESFWKNNRF